MFSVVKQAESQAIEGRGFVNEMLLQEESDVINHANGHGSWTFASLLARQPKPLGCGTVTNAPSRQVVPPDHQLARCVNLDWRTSINELHSKVQQAQIGGVTQRTGEVSISNVDVDHHA